MKFLKTFESKSELCDLIRGDDYDEFENIHDKFYFTEDEYKLISLEIIPKIVKIFRINLKYDIKIILLAYNDRTCDMFSEGEIYTISWGTPLSSVDNMIVDVDVNKYDDEWYMLVCYVQHLNDRGKTIRHEHFIYKCDGVSGLKESLKLIGK